MGGTNKLHHGVVVADDLEPRRVVAAILADLLVHLPLVLCVCARTCDAYVGFRAWEERRKPVAAWGSSCAA